MQQAECAHSATNSLTSPSNIDNQSATRRGMLTALAALPTFTLGASAMAVVVDHTLEAPRRASPVMVAIAAEIAACQRFNELPSDLEATNPALHAAEEDRLMIAGDRVVSAEPTNWRDLIAQVSHLTEEGSYGLSEEHMPLILRRMRGLAA